jgi:hypothetical protein
MHNLNLEGAQFNSEVPLPPGHSYPKHQPPCTVAARNLRLTALSSAFCHLDEPSRSAKAWAVTSHPATDGLIPAGSSAPLPVARPSADVSAVPSPVAFKLS